MLFRIFPFVLASLLVLGCSSSSSSPVDSGHPTDAVSRDAHADVHKPAPEAATDAVADSHVVTTKDAGVDAKSGAHDAATSTYDGPVYTLEAGITWTSLYRDYFANPKTASCSASGNCHGAASDHGAEVSSYVCPGGDASAACYAGITNQDAGFPLVTFDASFANDLLSQVLCNEDGGGSMPFDCTYTFTNVDLERINDWVAAGAQNN